MKINHIKRSALLVLSVAMLVSCEKESVENTVEKTQVSNLNVKTENGTLVFKDYQQMDLVRSKLSTLSETEIKSWETENGFQSLASIERKINDAEVAHQEIFSKD